jgi:hypothetical protein
VSVGLANMGSFWPICGTNKDRLKPTRAIDTPRYPVMLEYIWKRSTTTNYASL